MGRRLDPRSVRLHHGYDAFDTNGSSSVQQVLTTAQRDALTEVHVGDRIWNLTTSTLQAWTGTSWVDFTTGGVPVGRLINVMSTGQMDGGVVSINLVDPARFDLTAGYGVVVDNYTDTLNPTYTLVTWPAFTAQAVTHLATTDYTFLGIDSAGNLHQYDTYIDNSLRRDIIVLGALEHVSHIQIDSVIVAGNYICEVYNQVGDFWDAWGQFNVTGNDFSANGANLMLDKTAGTSFFYGVNFTDKKNPNVTTDPAISPVPFSYLYRDGLGGWIETSPSTTVVDPNHYDNNLGFPSVVPPGKWTIQTVWNMPGDGDIHIQYGQVLYDSLSQAEVASTMDFHIASMNNIFVFRCFLFVQSGCTSLNNPATAKLINMNNLGILSVTGLPLGGLTTASNIGLAGVGLFNAKVGVDLQFKDIAPVSSMISVNDNVVNHTVDIDLVPGNIAHTALDPATIGTNTHAQIDTFISEYGPKTLNADSTGVLDGGILSIHLGDTTKFDISDGNGVVVNNYTNGLVPTYTDVTWTGLISVPVLGAEYTFVAINAAGAVVTSTSEFTPSQRRDVMYIGALYCPDTIHISTVIPAVMVGFDTMNQFIDFARAFGPFNISGNVFGPNGANLKLDKGSGQTFSTGAGYEDSRKMPNINNDNPMTDLNFIYSYRDGVGGWTHTVPTDLVDPDNYDDNNIAGPQPVGGTNWTIQYIFYFTGGPLVGIQYGQAVYATKADAEAAIQVPIQLDPIVNLATFRGWLIVRNGATHLNDITQAEFIPAGKLGLASVMSGGTGGEANTASNIGLAGVGFYDQKLGVDLEFRNLNSLSSAITVTNDVPLKTVDIDLIPDNIGDFQKRIDNVFNTGLLKGGEITINLGDNSKFDIAAGQGYVVDNYTDPANPTRIHVTWVAQIAVPPSFLATSQWTYVGFDSAGVLQQQATPFTISQRRDIICIGKLVHNDFATIQVALQNCNAEFDTNLQFIGMTYVFQSMNVRGNVYSAAGATLRLNKTSGQTWRVGVNYKVSYKQPNISTDAPLTPVAAIYRDYQDGAGGWYEDPVGYLGIDPDNYDANNILGPQPVPAGKWTIQLIYHFGGGNRTWVQYGQIVYDSAAEALREQTANTVINPYFNEACFRCWLIVQQGCADLSDPTKAIFITAGALGQLDTVQGVVDVDNASVTPTDTSTFHGVLSASDTDVQKALNTLDANNYRRSFLLMGG